MLTDQSVSQIDRAEVDAAAPAQPTGADVALSRVSCLRVPVVVVLATRRMPIGKVRAFSAGSIIEFPKPLGSLLDLCVNNARIGQGSCVKIGENFGLRIDQIESRHTRIHAVRHPNWSPKSE